MKTPKKQGNAAANREGTRNSKTLLYWQIQAQHPEYSKEKCKVIAGYSPKTDTKTVESSTYYKELKAGADALNRPIEERIRQAQEQSGFNAASNLRRLQAIVERKGDQHDSAAIQAIKVGTEITGERMPEAINNTIQLDEQVLSKLLNM